MKQDIETERLYSSRKTRNPHAYLIKFMHAPAGIVISLIQLYTEDFVSGLDLY